MSKNDNYEILRYAGNGTADDFPVTWPFLVDGDVAAAVVTDATGAVEDLALTTDFTLAGAGEESGGTLTLTAGNLASGRTLVIWRDTDPTQPQVWRDGAVAAIRGKDIERGDDRLTLLVQEAFDRLDRCVQYGPTTAEADRSLDPEEFPAAMLAAQAAAESAQAAAEAAQAEAEVAQAAAEAAAAAITLPLPVASGGTGAATASGARTSLELGDSATKNVGTGGTNVAAGNHTHTGVYLPVAMDPTLSGGDHSYSGPTASLTAGENLAFGEVVYPKSDGKFWRADADAIASMPVVAMAAATISADASGVLILPGSFVRDDSWNWTVGGLIYASTDVGALTQTAPSGSGDVVQVVGYATHADRMFFLPSLAVVEVA